MATEFERTGNLQRKIDIYIDRQGYGAWEYFGSTNWHKTCKEAKAYMVNQYGYSENLVKTAFA
jgi:hypothetical protein